MDEIIAAFWLWTKVAAGITAAAVVLLPIGIAGEIVFPSFPGASYSTRVKIGIEQILQLLAALWSVVALMWTLFGAAMLSRTLELSAAGYAIVAAAALLFVGLVCRRIVHVAGNFLTGDLQDKRLKDV